MPTNALEAQSYADPAWTGNPGGGIVKRVSKSATYAVVSTSTNSIKFFQLPPNAKILGGGVFGTDVGAAGTINLKVTNGTVTKSLITAADITTGAYSHDAMALAAAAATGAVTAGGVALASWFGYVTTSDNFYVVVDFTAEPTTGSPTLQAYIEYTMDVETGEAT